VSSAGVPEESSRRSVQQLENSVGQAQFWCEEPGCRGVQQKDYCANTNVITYLLTYLLTSRNGSLVVYVLYSGGTRLTLRATNIVTGTTVTLVVRIVIDATDGATPQEIRMPSVRTLLFSITTIHCASLNTLTVTPANRNRLL